jgi:hypothetical protein
MTWQLFSSEEVDRLSEKPQPPDDDTPRLCPFCDKTYLRNYYHDYKSSGSPIPCGTSWF